MRNWDDALANMAYVPGSEALPEIWAERAARYRSALPAMRGDIAYGTNPRHRFDLVMPEGTPKGLVRLRAWRILDALRQILLDGSRRGRAGARLGGRIAGLSLGTRGAHLAKSHRMSARPSRPPPDSSKDRSA